MCECEGHWLERSTNTKKRVRRPVWLAEDSGVRKRMQDYKSAGDHALVRLIQHGDAGALEEFFERFSPPLRTFILRRLPTHDDADDVLQETLVAVTRAIMRFQSSSQAFTWVCAIARHKIADFYRNRRPCQSAPLDVETAAEPHGNLADELGEADLVHRALYALSPNERRALLAKYVHRYSTDELATMLGRTPKAVESLLTRARHAFEREYTHLQSEESGVE